MHILVPKMIIDEYKRGNFNDDFLAAGMFLDISGFSSMTNELIQHDQHGAEVLAIVMRKIFSELINIVYANSGFITNFAGDAFTALFPIGKDSSIQVRDCIAVAHSIQQYMSENPIQITPYGNFNITSRVGIATGKVNWGIVSSETRDRAAFYFRGEAVEKCVESEKLAAPGEIIIDSKTFELIEDSISTEPISDHYRIIQITDEISSGKPIHEYKQDLEISSLFYPKELITQPYLGEFRQVINMFINLPTVRTEDQLSILLQSLFSLQEKYGGLLNRVDFGDKGSHILLFWGAPVAHDNDIDRALDFVLALQTETSIPIKVGITYRTAHAGFIGSSLREEYTCYSLGINLAARFMSQAPRGQIWVDEQIAQRVKEKFNVKQLEEISLKGFVEKQKVFSVQERKEVSETFYEGKMVGRLSEIEKLSKFVNPLIDDRYAGIMFITGDAGIGKSRLLHEFIQDSEKLSDIGFKYALCQTDQVLRRSFNPFRYWLLEYFGVSTTQVESRNKRSFNQTLDQLIAFTKDEYLASELDRTRSFLGALVNLFWQDSLFEQLKPENRYENSLIGLITLLKAESLLQPLVIHLEDFQWIDRDSKILLSQLQNSILADQNRSFPIAILMTSRDSLLDSSLIQGINYEQLKMGLLSKKEIEKLIKSILNENVGMDLVTKLYSFGEGNPLFTEQILFYLKEKGLLVLEDMEWQLRDIERTPLPIDLRSLLVARIDQLPLTTKKIVLNASVLGREFDVKVLTKMVGFDKDFENPENIKNIPLWKEISEGRLLFKNNLVKDVAYRMQIHTRRQELHAIAVKAFENTYEEDLQSYYFDLAHHAEKGLLREKACQYLQNAGTLALKFFNNDMAIDFFTRALKHVPGSDLETRISVLLKRETIYSLLGNRDAQIKDLEEVTEIAKNISDSLLEASVAVRKANFFRSEPTKVIDAAKHAIALAEKAKAPQLIVSANNCWAYELRILGEYNDARKLLKTSRKLAQETNNISGEYLCLNNLGLVETAQGNYEQGKAFFEECYDVAHNNKLYYLEAQTLNNLGMVAGEQGDYASALDYYERALVISRKVGSRAGEGVIKTNLGWLSGIMGRYELAIKYLKNSSQIVKEIGARDLEASILVNLSLFSWAKEDCLLAKKYANLAIKLTRDINYRSMEAFALTYKGHALIGLQQFSKAESNYKKAIKIRQELNQSILIIEPFAGIAELHLKENNLVEARKYVDKILDHLDEGGSLDGIDMPMYIFLVCINVLSSDKNPRASNLLKDSYNLLEEQAGNIKDKELRRSFFENVPWHAEISRIFENSNLI